MLIIVPPSLGKTAPNTGKPLDVDSLTATELNPVRNQLLDAIQDMCTRSPDEAQSTLKIGKTQTDILAYNADLGTQHSARADSVYTGVLFDELDPVSMTSHVRNMFDDRVLIASALFGVVRPSDHIPAYRLTPEARLGVLGTVASKWKTALPRVLEDASEQELLLDLRSGSYQRMGLPTAELAKRTITLRVLSERGGERTVVSHYNKAYKGRIVRQLLDSGAGPRDVDELAQTLHKHGWQVEIPDYAVTKTGISIDIID